MNQLVHLRDADIKRFLEHPSLQHISASSCDFVNPQVVAKVNRELRAPRISKALAQSQMLAGLMGVT